MTTWVLADTHFRDTNCIKYRDFSNLQQMERRILDNCRRLISPQDTVYLLGDLASSREGLNLLRSIKGTKKIVWGNHDTMPLPVYLDYFPDSSFRMWYKIKNVLLTHTPIHPQELEYKSSSVNICPPRYNIHGHVHDFTIDDDRYFNTSVDANNWGPVKLQDILSHWNLPS